MRALILCFIAAIAACDALANPIAIDADRRPMVMRSERVDIVVGAGKSRVNGVFQFQQESPISDKQKHITLFVPIFLPETITARRYDALFGAPRVEGFPGRAFSAVDWNDIHLEGSPESVPLPRGWSMQLYVCNVPLRILGGTFEAKISYVQPHLPNDIAAYVPIRRLKTQRHVWLSFLLNPVATLRQVSSFSFLSSKKEPCGLRQGIES
jgi:hypothetical protein